MADTIELRDLVGPYRGRIRPYLRHAAQNAIDNGFAELPLEELPDDFPARSELVAAGFGHVEEVPRDAATLMTLPGIGKGKARQILEALGLQVPEPAPGAQPTPDPAPKGDDAPVGAGDEEAAAAEGEEA